MRQVISRSSGSAVSNFLAVALVASVLLLGGAALAEKRVVVLPFTGARAAAAEKTVTDVIKADHTVVPAKDYNRAATRLKLRPSTDETVAKVAADVQADAVVEGKVAKKGADWTIVVTVRAGQTGMIADTVTMVVPGGKMEAAQAVVQAELMPVITRAVGEDEPMPEAVGAAAVAPVVVATPEPAVAAKAEPLPAGPRAAADVSAGLSFTGRRFDFDENFPVGEKPNEYRGMFVPGLLVTGVVYPMMFVPKFKTSPLSDIGVTFVLDQALLLKSKDESNMLEYDTTMRRWGFGLRYRMNVSNIGLRFGAGYNNLSFLIKSGQFDPFPDTTYSYLDIGGGARIPVMDKLAILANVAYLVVFSTGEIENPEQYGSGSAMGFSVDAGAEYQIMPKLVVRASLRYQRMSFSFDGLGAKAMGAGPDMVVSGATDQYYGGSATAAYQF